jgi:DNA-binding LytR/AlgR family response regulator
MQNRLRALVLDDERPARNYLVELIEQSGLAEVVAAVGCLPEARELLLATSIDVAFVDVQLSCGENGLDLLRSPACEPRPAFVLATAFRQHAAQAGKLGAVDCLLKPLSEECVEECLRRIAALRAAPPR